MNQIFNIKRFLRYTRFILSMNRWYYGIVLVLFIIPATLLVMFRVDLGDNVAMRLIGAPTLMFSIVPFVFNTKYGGLARQIGVPASWLEKFLIESAVKFSPIAIPWGIHAVGCAAGVNGISGYFTDGLGIPNIVELMLWALLFGLICVLDSGKQGQNLSGVKMVSANWFMAICIGALQGTNIGAVPFIHGFSKFSPITTNIVILLDAALFITIFLLYRRRRVK